MSWRVGTVEKERERFIVAVEQGQQSFSEICTRFGISRKTGYKWKSRYELHGLEGLSDASRAPKCHRYAVSDDTRQMIVALRKRHPTWGPQKLLYRLYRDHPSVTWPAASTIGEILRREGLVSPRKRRRRTAPFQEALAHADSPNRVWSADFKGQFRLGNGIMCFPLTVSDNYSRYLFTCSAWNRIEFVRTQTVFTRLFREYGLPERIRTDNGVPFATTGVAGLSRLSVWLIRLGIIPERIDLGCPEQNGRHERMHRTLKNDATKPPAQTMRGQDTRMEQFRKVYNEDRPHEALDMQTPQEYYERSPRAFPETLPELEYERGVSLRRVRKDGFLPLPTRDVFLGEALAHQTVGLVEDDSDRLEVRFGTVRLGFLHDGKLIRSLGISGDPEA